MTYSIFTCDLTGARRIRRDADMAVIPEAADNIDWRAYQDWLAAGHTPRTIAGVATETTPGTGQLRAALAQAGRLAAADELVAACNDPELAAAWGDGRIDPCSAALLNDLERLFR